MFQRDYMLNEARKFALILAKLLGLKADGNTEEFRAAFAGILQSEYDTDAAILLALKPQELADYIKQGDFSTEKINALASLLYMYAEPFTPGNETVTLLNKVIIMFDILAQDHRYESFENLDKRNKIYQFFKTHYGSTTVESLPL